MAKLEPMRLSPLQDREDGAASGASPAYQVRSRG
jgi:hypothetical protein